MALLITWIMQLVQAQLVIYYPQTQLLSSRGKSTHIKESIYVRTNDVWLCSGSGKDLLIGLTNEIQSQFEQYYKKSRYTGWQRRSRGRYTPTARYAHQSWRIRLCYWHCKQSYPPAPVPPAQQPEQYIHKPFGFSYFPWELIPAPRSWVELTGDLVFWKEHTKVRLPAYTDQEVDSCVCVSSYREAILPHLNVRKSLQMILSNLLNRCGQSSAKCGLIEQDLDRFR